jgi:DNA helicase-2/ATP-dependent DNA helicase PcrA
MLSPTLLSSLNPPQRKAVETLSGPLLVLAGAGTGKTRVVTYRVANLIRHGTPPEKILAVTFTNRAAEEMKERAAALLGRPQRGRGKAGPEISTFHSLCVRILKRHIEKLGYPARFSICDQADQDSLARTALREVRAADGTLRPADFLSIVGRWKSAGLGPQQAASQAASDREHLAAAAYRRYQNALKGRGAVDFDDLLLLVGKLFDKWPAVRQAEAARFAHVLIDEYQDTNTAQYAIVRHLADGHRNLCVVGDDDQAIYGFRGADVTHILSFQRDWPDATMVRLEDNYRSSASILELANRLILFNRRRHEKRLKAARGEGIKPNIWQLQNEEDEARKVVADIKSRLKEPGAAPRDFAILCRTNEQPRSFETELRAAEIPYILIGSRSFFDRREVRDVLAFLKVAVNPADEVALLRILNVPARGIGDSARKTMLEAAVARGVPLWQLVSHGGLPAVSDTARKGVQRLKEVVVKLQALAAARHPAEVVQSAIHVTGYRAHLEQTCDDPVDRQAREASLEELVNAAAGYETAAKTGAKRPSLADFLERLAMGERDESDRDSKLARNAVALLTLHSAKGLEFPNVYLVGMEEGILPHRRAVEEDGAAIDEERRLCYVGVTRAQEKLTLTLALTRKKWGKPRDSLPSRFLFEMTGKAEQWTAIAARHNKNRVTSR